MVAAAPLASAVPTWLVLGGTEFFVTLLLTLWLVRFYAAKGAPWYATALVFVSWYLGFFGTLFLPIDIAEAYFSTAVELRNVTGPLGPAFPNALVASASPSASVRPSASAAASGSPSASATPAASGSPSGSPTSTPPPSATGSDTGSPSTTPSFGSTASPTTTPSSTRSASVTPSPTPSRTGTPTASRTPPPASASHSPSRSFVFTATPSETNAFCAICVGGRRAAGLGRGAAGALEAASQGDASGHAGASSSGGFVADLIALFFGGGEPGGGAAYGEGRGGDPHDKVGAENEWGLADGAGGGDGGAAAAAASSAPELDGATARRRGLQATATATATATASPLAALPTGAGGGNSSGVAPPTASARPSASATPGPPLGWGLVSVEVRRRNPHLEDMWTAVYWATFVLTYVVIPIVQEYVAAGEFTRRGRFCASVQINMMFYAVCGVFAFGAFAYVIVGLNQGLADLQPVLISLANTMGLVIIILLLGYGTAEVPRAIWNESDAAGELHRLYFQAPALDALLFDARGTVQDVLKRIRDFEAQLAAMAADKSLAEKSPARHQSVPELQRCLAIVNEKVAAALALTGGAPKARKETPEQARRRAALEQRFRDEQADAEAADKERDKAGGGWFGGLSRAMGGGDKYRAVTVAKLAKLHKALIAEVASLHKAQARFDALVTRCMMLEFAAAGTSPPVPRKRKTAEGATYYVIAKGAQPLALPGDAHMRPTVFNTKGGAASSAAPAASGGVPASDANMDVLSEGAGRALERMHFLPDILGGALNRASWHFRIHVLPWAFKGLWLAAEVSSLLLLWSEATIALNLTGLVKPNLSVFGWMLISADDAAPPPGAHNYVALQLASLFPLVYMCLCSTYSVFQLKLFGMMDLAGHQNTDPYSLLVCASLFNRLQFSLAFNYLNVLMHSTNRDDFPPTAFQASIGARMDLSLVE